MRVTLRNERSGGFGQGNHNSRDTIHYDETDKNQYWYYNDKHQRYLWHTEADYDSLCSDYGTINDIALGRYYTLYSDGLEAKNSRYTAQGHSEHCKSIKDLYKGGKTAPHETILQIGRSTDHIDPNDLKKATTQLIRLMHSRAGIEPIDACLHLDEQTPHVHLRWTGGVCDKDGYLVPNVTGCLREHGYGEAVNRYDNPLTRFTRDMREWFQEIVKDLGYDIETEPLPPRKHLSTEEYKSLRRDILEQERIRQRLKDNDVPER